MKKHVHTTKPPIGGHCLIHNKWAHTHVMQFCPADDGKFVMITSWNTPPDRQPPWVRVAQRIMKLERAREFWKSLRRRGYFALSIVNEEDVYP